MKNMTEVEIIMELEGGELIVNDNEELEILKNLCKKLASSQGFYGRLLRDILQAEQNGEIEFPIIL